MYRLTNTLNRAASQTVGVRRKRADFRSAFRPVQQPALDTLEMAFVTETPCRRSGVVAFGRDCSGTRGTRLAQTAMKNAAPHHLMSSGDFKCRKVNSTPSNWHAFPTDYSCFSCL